MCCKYFLGVSATFLEALQSLAVALVLSWLTLNIYLQTGFAGDMIGTLSFFHHEIFP